MKGLNSWAQGIIFAIIIGSIIQMILPENKNKKYVKIVIGIYILFTIISPLTGKSFSLEDYNFENYINIENEEKSSNSKIYDENVQKIFKKKVIDSIELELKSKGYKAKNINATIENSNVEKIEISGIYENKEKTENFIKTINTIEIEIMNKENNEISKKDKDDIKKFLSETYQIDENKILIE